MKLVKKRVTTTIFALGLFLSSVTLAPAQPIGITPHERAEKVVLKIRGNELTLEKAFEQGQLDKQTLLVIVGDDKLPDPNHRLWDSGHEAHRWTSFLLSKFPEVLTDIDQHESEVRVRVGLYLCDKGDKHGAEILEKIIDEQPRQQPDKNILLSALYNLCDFYRGSRQNSKAYDTAVKVKEFNLTPTEQSNILLGAARALAGSGDKEAAMVAYEEVIDLGYGWATGHAYKDMAELLFRDGKQEEARALLKTPITGINSDMGMVLTKERLMGSYFATGELEQARYWAQATIDQYENSSKSIRGMEWFAESARRKLDAIKTLQKSPLVAKPGQFELDTANSSKLIKQQFVVSAYRSASIKATSAQAGVTLKLRKNSAASTTIDAEFDLTKLKDVKLLEIQITADEFPHTILRIPVTLRAKS